ncbi:unnamed protein product [Lactuca saligna]|uniref:RRM domain-containing protein n=1 Tax=Lactuca saligna TaxID=75948 RepID=A0AA35Z729_LACSI|nr:unnamed protein product [Lactuca saligna]
MVGGCVVVGLSLAGETDRVSIGTGYPLSEPKLPWNCWFRNRNRLKRFWFWILNSWNRLSGSSSHFFGTATRRWLLGTRTGTTSFSSGSKILRTDIIGSGFDSNILGTSGFDSGSDSSFVKFNRLAARTKQSMSHFGRSGPPDISDTYSLLILNISFRTTADDLFPLFDKYGKVVDIFIPKDRRTGDSRGFAFVRYKYADEAEKAVDRLDGREVDGREITVQFAKYGPNAERIHRGRVIDKSPRARGRSRSRSPRQRYHDNYYRDRDREYRRKRRSRSWDRSE